MWWKSYAEASQRTHNKIKEIQPTLYTFWRWAPPKENDILWVTEISAISEHKTETQAARIKDTDNQSTLAPSCFYGQVLPQKEVFSLNHVAHNMWIIDSPVSFLFTSWSEIPMRSDEICYAGWWQPVHSTMLHVT